MLQPEEPIQLRSLLHCVLVGCDGVGKRSLINAFGAIPFCSEQYSFVPPGAVQHFVATVEVDGAPENMLLWDTAAGAEFDRCRHLWYGEAHVALVCFSIGEPQTLEAAETRWAPALLQAFPTVPRVLVGAQADLRDDTCERERRRLCREPVPQERAADTATRIGAAAYCECSARTAAGVADVFRCAARLAVDYRRLLEAHPESPSKTDTSVVELETSVVELKALAPAHDASFLPQERCCCAVL
eukprot:TRINITY_DN1290_c0_g1_i2.p1 TRINITY_DN1290_c0_g1~~TRINITY_DN1290_c0_g1_i2.p1  ORF type:complete len:243 (+),score=69.73 TRINITY_DN1290_c0_g1_i2:206-934(+)